MRRETETENVFESGLDTWLVAEGQVPAPQGHDGLLRTMAVVLLGAERLEPTMAERLLPIGPWASHEEAERDPQALARLREMPWAEKQDLRRALFGARKYLARHAGQDVDTPDPREWVFQAALEHLQQYLVSTGWEIETVEDAIPLRAVVETIHPKKEGPVLRFIVSSRGVSVSDLGWTATPALDGGCVSCVRAQGCEQICPFYGRSFCQVRTHGIGWRTY